PTISLNTGTHVFNEKDNTLMTNSHFSPEYLGNKELPELPQNADSRESSITGSDDTITPTNSMLPSSSNLPQKISTKEDHLKIPNKNSSRRRMTIAGFFSKDSKTKGQANLGKGAHDEHNVNKKSGLLSTHEGSTVSS